MLDNYKSYNFTGNFTAELIIAYAEVVKDADTYKGLNDYNRERFEESNDTCSELYAENEKYKRGFDELQESYKELEQEFETLKAKYSELERINSKLEEQNNTHFSADDDMCVGIPKA